jgi:isopenicillin N synthase-like dioxygenase
MDVAVVDFASANAPEIFTRSLRETGFAVLVNHPLPWSLVEQIYREWAALFKSPEIHKYLMDASGQAGWFPPDRSETAKGNTVRDLKEFFHVYDWSVYPDEVSDAAMQYRQIAIELASTLLGWIEANTPPEIAAKFSMPLAQMITDTKRTLLRVLNYPPLIGEIPEGAVRAAAHEDINLLTVLPASDEPGLELLRSDGTWFPVPCDPGSLAVNGGEMLDLASEGWFPATTHRVVNPHGEAANRARMSLPLFLAPGDDVILSNGKSASYFLQKRIAELRSSDAG